MYGHKYTDEEKAFLKEYVPGHSHAEIAKAFTEKFGWEMTPAKVKSYIGNNHLNTGRTGRFQKGCSAHNKGKKVSPEVYEKMKKTMFTKGHIAEGHKPIGSERVNREGYIEIKVAEPNKWRLKHNVVWETHNGTIPKGSIVIFLDGNQKNVDISNLHLITRAENLYLNRNNLRFSDPESTLTATNIAKLQIKAMEKQRNMKQKIE